jgi:hypothetical protein
MAIAPFPGPVSGDAVVTTLHLQKRRLGAKPDIEKSKVKLGIQVTDVTVGLSLRFL